MLNKKLTCADGESLLKLIKYSSSISPSYELVNPIIKMLVNNYQAALDQVQRVRTKETLNELRVRYYETISFLKAINDRAPSFFTGSMICQGSKEYGWEGYHLTMMYLLADLNLNEYTCDFMRNIAEYHQWIKKDLFYGSNLYRAMIAKCEAKEKKLFLGSPAEYLNAILASKDGVPDGNPNLFNPKDMKVEIITARKDLAMYLARKLPGFHDYCICKWDNERCHFEHEFYATIADAANENPICKAVIFNIYSKENRSKFFSVALYLSSYPGLPEELIKRAAETGFAKFAVDNKGASSSLKRYIKKYIL